MKNLKVFQKVIALVGTVVIAGSLTGCVKKSKCNIPYEHAHKYVSGSTGATTYRDSETEWLFPDFARTDDTVALSQKIADMTRFNLLGISENQEYLSKQMEKNKPYKLYEISFVSTRTKMIDIRIDESIPRNKKDAVIFTGINIAWAKEEDAPDHTDNMCDVTFKYIGYKVYTDDKGRRITMRSEPVDDIFSITNEYPYFRMDDFYTEEYSDTYKNESHKTR